MGKIERTLSKIDRKVDKKLGFLRKFFSKYFPVVSTFFFALLVIVFVAKIFYSRPRIIASIIEDDIKLITLALEKIDAKCSILTIEGDHNEINFLNVKKFSGSQVGPLGLAYADRWAGPYIRINPTLQETFYEIVKAKDGIFVIPGRGVVLPSGLKIGKDFVVGTGTEVGKMTEEGGPLTFEGKKFASKLMFEVGDWETWQIKEDTVKDIDRMIREFNEAMPFTCNSHACNSHEKDRWA
jgi:hypothetical protein